MSKRTVFFERGDETMEGTLSPYDDDHYIFYPSTTPDCFESGRLVKIPKTMLVDANGDGENGWSLAF
jgi:hypothetical protein